MDVLNGQKVIKCKLLTFKEDLGDYTTYVFQNLDTKYKTDLNYYIMCTKFPNWDSQKINIGDIGFLNYKIIIAGKDQWYDKDTESFKFFNYDMCQFLKFIPDKKEEDLKCIMN